MCLQSKHGVFAQRNGTHKHKLYFLKCLSTDLRLYYFSLQPLKFTDFATIEGDRNKTRLKYGGVGLTRHLDKQVDRKGGS